MAVGAGAGHAQGIAHIGEPGRGRGPSALAAVALEGDRAVGGRWRGGPLRLVPDGSLEPGQVVWQLVNTQAELVRLLSLAHTLRDEEQCLRDAIDGGDGPAEGGPAAALSQLAETQAALIDAFSAAHGLRDQIDSLYRLLAGSAPSAPRSAPFSARRVGAKGAEPARSR